MTLSVTFQQQVNIKILFNISTEISIITYVYFQAEPLFVFNGNRIYMHIYF